MLITIWWSATLAPKQLVTPFNLTAGAAEVLVNGRLERQRVAGELFNEVPWLCVCRTRKIDSDVILAADCLMPLTSPPNQCAAA